MSSAHTSSPDHAGNIPNVLTRSTSQQSNVERLDPLKCHDYFDLRPLVTIRELFYHRVHYGHNQGCRNDYMRPFLFGTRVETDIIDLDQTKPLLQDALNFAAHIAYKNGIILFVSRNKYMMPWVEKTALRCGEYAHCRYWRHGTFTDSRNVFGQTIRLPDLCIFLHTQNSVFKQHKAVTDCAKLMIPTIGIVDSDCDPRLITYPVPGNDDSPTSQLYYLRLFEKAILKGKAKRQEDIEKNSQ